MLSPAEAAATLGVSVPSGAFDDVAEGVPLWTASAAENVWSVAMGTDDARKLARDLVEPALRRAGKQLADGLSKGTVAATVGPIVAAAVPIVGTAAAVIGYFVAALKQVSESIEGQRDTVREGKRESLLASNIGFKAGELHCFVGPWDTSPKWANPFRPRDYSLWQAAPGYAPIFEVTPACFPAWNPYHRPGPHVPPKGEQKRSTVNDILVAAQLAAFGDPGVLVTIRRDVLSAMAERARSTRAGDELVFRDRSGVARARRVATAEEVELWRRGIGTVAAARVELFKRPDLVRAATLYRKRIGGPLEPRSGAAPDAVELALATPAPVGVSSAALGDVTFAPARRAGLLALGFAAVATGLVAATRGTR